MTIRRFDTKALALTAATLILACAAVSWLRRREWTDHDVSDPGIT